MSVGTKLLNLLKSLLISYIITGILLLIIAFALYKFGISENVVNLAIIAVYVAASFVGGFITGKLVKEKKFLWGFLLGLMYMVVIGIVSFVLNGTISFSGSSFFSAFVMCVGGGMLGGMLS